jgi:hypothetical protein
VLRLLSGDDVKRIGAALEQIELLPAITENPVVGRIEVLDPGVLDGSGEVVGYFERNGVPNGSGEAWFGFVIDTPE